MLADFGGRGPAQLPDAIVCSNDQMAIGVLRTLAARGIRVPEDIALVGFDDIYPATLCDPPLTTVRQPIRGIGERACEQLIERIANPTLRPSVELLPTELVIRSSCGCPPGTVVRKLVRDRRPQTNDPIRKVGEGMSYLLRRLAFYLVAAWVAITLNFFIPRAVPGNPAEIILSKYPDLTPQAYKALEQMIGGVVGTGSLWSQYLHYWSNVFHFNFGVDLANYPTPVSSILDQTDPVDADPGRHRDGDRLRGRHRARHPGRLAARRLARPVAPGLDVLPGHPVLLPRAGAGRLLRGRASTGSRSAQGYNGEVTRPGWTWAFIVQRARPLAAPGASPSCSRRWPAGCCRCAT